MRLISCAMTVDQVIDESKTETRRIGWEFLEPGDRLIACEKLQGLGKGGRPRPLKAVEVTAVRREYLDEITEKEVEREGFPAWTPEDFVSKFCTAMKCDPGALVTVIQWRYLRLDELTEHERDQWDRLVAKYTMRPRIGKR